LKEKSFAAKDFQLVILSSFIIW